MAHIKDEHTDEEGINSASGDSPSDEEPIEPPQPPTIKIVRPSLPSTAFTPDISRGFFVGNPDALAPVPNPTNLTNPTLPNTASNVTPNAKLDQKLEKLDQIIENEDSSLERQMNSKRSFSPNSNPTSPHSSRTSVRQNSGLSASLTDGKFSVLTSRGQSSERNLPVTIVP